MKSTGTSLTVATIPFVWRLRMMLHGVRLSRLAHDELTTGCDDEQLTYRVTMTDEGLVGADSAPLVVRINLRAASFVLRAFAQQCAEIRADSRGALFALHCASDDPCGPIATHVTKGQQAGGNQQLSRSRVAFVPTFRTATRTARASSPPTPLSAGAGWTGNASPAAGATAGGVSSAVTQRRR
jgi:hypothetical protein